MSTIAAGAAREQSEPEDARPGSVEDLIEKTVDPGEQVLFIAKVLRRMTFQLFEKAMVVLTDQRLIVLTPAFPSGWELNQAHANAACSILNTKERFDGSRIVAFSHEDGTLCLYFPRQWRAQAEWICQTIDPAGTAAQN